MTLAENLWGKLKSINKDEDLEKILKRIYIYIYIYLHGKMGSLHFDRNIFLMLGHLVLKEISIYIYFKFKTKYATF